MAKISTDAEINSLRLKEQASAPSTPASGYGQLYEKDDGKFYCKNDAGTEICLSDILANPMTTAGDIIYGGASGTPTRLAAGTENQVLTMGATNPAWAAASAGTFIGARYATNAQQVIATATNTIIDFEDQSFDTNSAVTTGASWKFTAPATGYYQVNCMIMFANSSAWAAAELAKLEIFKNGTLWSVLWRNNQQSTTEVYVMARGSDIVQLNATDYIDIRVYQNTGGNLALYTNAENNYVSIAKL